MIGCANYGSVVAGGQAGGVVGEISSWGSTEEKPVGVMVGCGNYGTVEAREWAGGLAGFAEGIMEDCYNLGTVKGRGRRWAVWWAGTAPATTPPCR